MAAERWAAVTATDVDPAWRLTPPQQQTRAKLVAQQRIALDTLKQALERNDAAATIKAAVAIKPAFTRIYEASAASSRRAGRLRIDVARPLLVPTHGSAVPDADAPGRTPPVYL